MRCTFTHNPAEFCVAAHLAIPYELTLAEIENVTDFPHVKEKKKDTEQS